ncbi:MAG: hypothetical protein CM15mP70_08060 [Pelagibacteraceae bacterium]|nr:MAG: hypothetical protein CM15mP70_08060 [Pelagibacteraceae bacterium]
MSFETFRKFLCKVFLIIKFKIIINKNYISFFNSELALDFLLLILILYCRINLCIKDKGMDSKY